MNVRQKGGKKKKTIENFLPLGFFPFSKVTGGEKKEEKKEKKRGGVCE